MYLYRYDKPLKLYRLFKYYDFKAAEIIYKYCTVSEKSKINVKYYPWKIDRVMCIDITSIVIFFLANFSIFIFLPFLNFIDHPHFSYFFFFISSSIWNLLSSLYSPFVSLFNIIKSVFKLRNGKVEKFRDKDRLQGRQSCRNKGI